MALAKDYYRMEREELLKAIWNMRGWLFNFPRHEQYGKVWFALEVACAARDLSDDPLPEEILAIFV